MIQIKPLAFHIQGVSEMNHRTIGFVLPAMALALSACTANMPKASVEPAPMAAPAPAPTAPAAKPVAERYPALVGDSAKPTPASMVSPLAERREAFTATGYAVVSVQPHKVQTQQRLMAIRASKLDAYRSLTEQVYGQQLDATTTVADMVIRSDSFRTRVEGIIYGARLESINPVGEDTYETTLSLDARVVADIRALFVEQLTARR